MQMQINSKPNLSICIQKSQFTYNEHKQEQTISISLECPEEVHQDMETAILMQTKYQNLKNPSKYKQKQLTTIKINILKYESQTNMIEKHFKDLTFDEQTNSKISLYLHPNHSQLLQLHPPFKEYLLQGWNSKLTILFTPPNILTLQGQFSLQNISQIKKKIVSHISKTHVIKWDDNKLNSQYLNLLKNFQKIRNTVVHKQEKSSFTYFYTKDQQQSKDLIKILSNLQQRQIQISKIFMDPMKLRMFQLFYLKNIINQTNKIIITQNQQKTMVYGQITDILEFQKLLHLKFINMLIREIQIEITPAKLQVVNKYIKKSQQSKQVNLIHKLDNIQGLNILHISISSYNKHQLQEFFYSFLNDLDRISFKIITTSLPITSQKLKIIRKQYNLDVISQNDLIIVQGLNSDILKLEKNSKFLDQKSSQIPTKNIKQKKRTLRQFKQQNKVCFKFTMNKIVSDRFQIQFRSKFHYSTQGVQDLSIITVYLPSQEEQLLFWQQKIIDFCISNCGPTIKNQLHSQHFLEVQELEISQTTIQILNQWKIDYKVVLEVNKIHNKNYEYIYLQSQGCKDKNYIWMPLRTTIEQSGKLILNDLRSFGNWENGCFNYLFNFSVFEAKKYLNNCLLLATTYKQIADLDESAQMSEYEFMPMYLVKLNQMAINFLSQSLDSAS